MKITLSGSLGHISKPLMQDLVQQGHDVIVITSNPKKATDIEALGATAAIGSLEDPALITHAFTGADAVYTMVPPNNYFDHNLDLLAYYRRLGHHYKEAIEQSGVKRVVNLSSIGAHRSTGIGILVGAHDVEGILNELPSHVAITHIRPVSFYYNLLAYIPVIKHEGVIATNYGDPEGIPWVSPLDIAAAVAEELIATQTGRKVRYVASDEVSGPNTARALGQAIGKPDLKWVVVSDEQVRKALVAAGMNPGIATGLAELYAGFRTGVLQEDYLRHRPALMGSVKIADYAREFANAYNK